MSGGSFHHALGVRSPKSLAARGGLARTFGGLAGFLVLILLCAGFYILQDAFADPLNAAGTAVICAAFIITLGAMLLYFLINPRKRLRKTAHLHVVDPSGSPLKPIINPHIGPPSDAARAHPSPRGNLAYQRFYVDHFRIRP